MAKVTPMYLDELSYVLNSRKNLAGQRASSVGDLLNAEEDIPPVGTLETEFT